MRRAVTATKPTLGFGCPNEIDPHHFIVTIPADHKRPVLITENYGIQSISGEGLMDRCELSWHTWAALAEDVRVEFNRRLKEKRLPTSRWKVGENKVERLLGKELLVLAWGVEQADLATLQKAVKNWQGLRPEERWWLCTMTAAATGSTNDAGLGWRAALQHLLTENPVEGIPPNARPREVFSSEDTGGLYRPIQTVKAISDATGISRITLAQAAGRGDFGEDVYKSGETWLIDTTGSSFQMWLAAHPSQRRVKGRRIREQQEQEKVHLET